MTVSPVATAELSAAERELLQKLAKSGPAIVSTVAPKRPAAMTGETLVRSITQQPIGTIEDTKLGRVWGMFARKEKSKTFDLKVSGIDRNGHQSFDDAVAAAVDLSVKSRSDGAFPAIAVVDAKNGTYSTTDPVYLYDGSTFVRYLGLDKPPRYRATIKPSAEEIVAFVTPDALYDFRQERELGLIPQIVLTKQ